MADWIIGQTEESAGAWWLNGVEVNPTNNPAFTANARYLVRSPGGTQYLQADDTLSATAATFPLVYVNSVLGWLRTFLIPASLKGYLVCEIITPSDSRLETFTFEHRVTEHDLDTVVDDIEAAIDAGDDGAHVAPS